MGVKLKVEAASTVAKGAPDGTIGVLSMVKTTFCDRNPIPSRPYRSCLRSRLMNIPDLLNTRSNILCRAKPGWGKGASPPD